ncbi:MAG: uncharacterized protein JWO95_3453 [Verrucomicrobiales bacterium]|nr:uncharacterized protein [Verrucomicrobiales bacterium]
MKINSPIFVVNAAKQVRLGLVLAMAVIFQHLNATAAQAPVDLGTAGNFVILAKSGISTVPTSAVTGDIGVSPIDSTAITGFSLNLTAGSAFATSAQITGKVYAPGYASPTPANLTTAVGDMETAYTDAAGRSLPDFTELGAGEIGGLTLVPGLYKWGTDVLISTDVTLNGGPNDVWIFQIAGKITQASSTQVHLTGGALAANVFWQAFGDVTLGSTAHFEGIIMAQTSISLGTGASIKGRLLAQTAVTLKANTVTAPSAINNPFTLVSAATATGLFTKAAGQSVDLKTKTISVPKLGNMRFYRVIADTALTITRITISGGNVVITYN